MAPSSYVCALNSFCQVLFAEALKNAHPDILVETVGIITDHFKWNLI